MPRPRRKATAWAVSIASATGSAAAASASPLTPGRTSSEYSYGLNSVEERMEARRGRKWFLGLGLEVHCNSLVAAQELGRQEEVLARETSGEDAAVQLGLADGLEGRAGGSGLGLVVFI